MSLAGPERRILRRNRMSGFGGVAKGARSAAEELPRNPTTGITGCCAREARGHAAAAPLIANMNCRLPIPTAIRSVPSGIMPAALWARYHAPKWRSVAVIRPTSRWLARQFVTLNDQLLQNLGAVQHGQLPLTRCSTSYSITSSASASSDGGTVRASALAVFRLMTNSNLVGCRTGRSTVFSPLRIRPA